MDFSKGSTGTSNINMLVCHCFMIGQPPPSMPTEVNSVQWVPVIHMNVTFSLCFLKRINNN